MRAAIPFAVFALIAWVNVASGQERDGEGPRDRKTLFSWPKQSNDASEDEESEETEEEPIATDRPDFTESSTTVGRGTIQLETGYTYFEKRDGGLTTSNHSWGEPLLRVGVWAEWFELRAGAFPASLVEGAGGVQTRQSGVEDLYLGCKLGLTEQSGWLPEVALVPQMTVPTGSSAFTNEKVLPGTNLLYGWDITDKHTFAGSTQFNQSVDALDETYTEWAQTLTIGTSLTDRWGMYQEWFMFSPDDSTVARVEHYYNGGLLYLVTPDIQWDVRAGVGLSEASDDYFLGIGICFRRN